MSERLALHLEYKHPNVKRTLVTLQDGGVLWGHSPRLLVPMCRYSKVADWAYIRACAQATAGALPLIGNGDVVSFEDFHAHLEEAPELATIMLARGALVKPWIFTEVGSGLQQHPACTFP